MKKKSIQIFRGLIIIIAAVVISGITMALLNVLFEGVIRNSIFKSEEVLQVLFLSYLVIWIVLGTFLGIIYLFYLSIRNKLAVISLPSLTYLYVFSAIWLFLFSYINYYHLPWLFSIKSIIWNLVIFICGGLLFILMKKQISSKKLKPIFKFHVFLLSIFLIFSFLLSLGILTKIKRELLWRDIKSDKLNVIVILLDAVRSDHLGCYGYERETTPNIDRLAAKGVIFENAYATASHTLESVPSIFTSTYPSTHNVGTFSSGFPKKILLLPEIFKSRGYKTALFGNTVISEKFGYHRGIDHYFGPKMEPMKEIIKHSILIDFMTKQSAKKISVLRLLAKKTIDFSNGLQELQDSSTSYDPDQTEQTFFDPDYITHNMKTWISDNHNHPFFIYAHYWGAHDPYDPPEPYDRLFDPDFPGTPITLPPGGPLLFFPFVKGSKMPKRHLENMIAQYDGEIFYHDKSLGLLFDHLKALGVDKKTIILITADHGEEFYEHNGYFHGHSLFEETIHVPLIFYVPGIDPMLNRINELVSLVDIFPTLLSLTGISADIKIPYDIEGMDLSPTFITKNHFVPREFIFSELHKGADNSASCIRTKKYKAIMKKFGNEEERMLFDLDTDPFERKNIYEEEKELGDEFFNKIISLVREAVEKSFEPETVVMDEKLKEKLRSLGYIK